MEIELHVSERLMFDAKITSTRIAWLDDSAKIHASNYRRFTVFGLLQPDAICRILSSLPFCV